MDESIVDFILQLNEEGPLEKILNNIEFGFYDDAKLKMRLTAANKKKAISNNQTTDDDKPTLQPAAILYYGIARFCTYEDINEETKEEHMHIAIDMRDPYTSSEDHVIARDKLLKEYEECVAHDNTERIVEILQLLEKEGSELSNAVNDSANFAAYLLTRKIDKNSTAKRMAATMSSDDDGNGASSIQPRAVYDLQRLKNSDLSSESEYPKQNMDIRALYLHLCSLCPSFATSLIEYINYNELRCDLFHRYVLRTKFGAKNASTAGVLMHIAAMIKSLYMNESTADVRLRAECDPDAPLIPAHKFILTAYSSYFHAMFEGSCKIMKNDNVCVLSDISPMTIREILYYMYHGVINVDALPDVGEFIYAVKFLQINSLLSSLALN